MGAIKTGGRRDKGRGMGRNGTHLQPFPPGLMTFVVVPIGGAPGQAPGVCARPRAGEGLSTAASADLCHEVTPPASAREQHLKVREVTERGEGPHLMVGLSITYHHSSSLFAHRSSRQGILSSPAPSARGQTLSPAPRGPWQRALLLELYRKTNQLLETLNQLSACTHVVDITRLQPWYGPTHPETRTTALSLPQGCSPLPRHFPRPGEAFLALFFGLSVHVLEAGSWTG